MSTFIPGHHDGIDAVARADSWTRRAALTVAAAAMIALGARISLQLPFTDVPVTGQVFCVLMAGGLLGARDGALSVVEYLAAGCAGAPVFANGAAGPASLIGPTGGYLIGFIGAAIVAGAAASRRRSALTLAGMVAAAGLIELCGGVWRHVVFGHSWAAVLGLAIAPFAAVDAGKALLAWQIVTRTRGR